jgi:hypothetical protein
MDPSYGTSNVIYLRFEYQPFNFAVLAFVQEETEITPCRRNRHEENEDSLRLFIILYLTLLSRHLGGRRSCTLAIRRRSVLGHGRDHSP